MKSSYNNMAQNKSVNHKPLILSHVFSIPIYKIPELLTEYIHLK